MRVPKLDLGCFIPLEEISTTAFEVFVPCAHLLENLGERGCIYLYELLDSVNSLLASQPFLD